MKLKQLLLFIVMLIISCFLSFSLFAQTTVGMLAHFKMDGSITNLGSANVTGTAIGTSYTTNNANVPNTAIQFAGNVNSYVDFVDNGNLDFPSGTNFTISFSFYFNGASTGGLIDNCLNYGGWGVWFWSQVSGVWNIQFNYKNNSVGSSAATAFTLNQWHHVAAVRNNGTISIYIDGVFRLSAAEGATAPTYPLNMIAGCFAFSGFTPPRYNPLNGKLDEVRIYNRALSAAEIAELTPFALPLKLGDFTASKKPTGIQLNWETLSEQNASHFEVERSTDGTNYISIGRVNATGNSAIKQYYTYLDVQPYAGTNLYRLKLADINSAFTYSRVIAVKNDNSLITLQLFPNPVSDVLQVQLPSGQKETVNITITDAAGKSVYFKPLQVSEGINAISIPVQHFSKGTYYLVIDNKEGRQSKAFIKQ
jgi:Concanavalin A-like lectin/glucanases superfamily/Secretion system C-terminal sorting domain